MMATSAKFAAAVESHFSKGTDKPKESSNITRLRHTSPWALVVQYHVNVGSTCKFFCCVFFLYISTQSLVVFVCTVAFSNVFLTSLVLFNSTLSVSAYKPMFSYKPTEMSLLETDQPMGLSARFYGTVCMHATGCKSVTTDFLPDGEGSG